MINKLRCLMFGHIISISKCPVTGVEIKRCFRCSPYIKHNTDMSFN
jgi:hypothetical protein